MPYPELLIQPMREDLTRIGVVETRTPEAVDAALAETPGTLLLVVNSVCGCAAGKARPALRRALQHARVPSRAISVFAGADIEATERARQHMAPYPPSSPSIGLFRDGKLVFAMQRHEIEGRDAETIAQHLEQAFDQHC